MVAFLVLLVFIICLSLGFELQISMDFNSLQAQVARTFRAKAIKANDARKNIYSNILFYSI